MWKRGTDLIDWLVVGADQGRQAGEEGWQCGGVQTGQFGGSGRGEDRGQDKKHPAQPIPPPPWGAVAEEEHLQPEAHSPQA